MLKLSVLLLVGTWLSFPRPENFYTRNSHSCCLSLRFGIVVKWKLLSSVVLKAIALANCDAL